MAAKGSISKEIITQKILEVFEGSFPYEKEIRIPMIEEGEEVQIKIALTCAKVNVERGDAAIAPAVAGPVTATATPVVTITEPSAEEKKAVEDLMSVLGLI